MAKFVYKMQSLLNIKMKMEDQAKSAYSLARTALNEEEAILQSFITKKSDYVEEKRQKMSAAIHIRELTQLEYAIKSMDYKIAEQILSGKQEEKNMQLAQAKLENAMKEHKIQEKLKEHAFEEFLKEMDAADQKEINELVSFRFGKTKERED